MSYDQSNIQPFLDSYAKSLLSSDNPIKTQDDTSSVKSETNSNTSRSRRSSSKTELIEKDGKTVSKNATGKRKFHNKSKLGCDTCKRRRVKCDEGKPICNKCKNMGIECTYNLVAAAAQPKKESSEKSIPSPALSNDTARSNSVSTPNLSSNKRKNEPKTPSIPDLSQSFPFPIPKSIIEGLQSNNIDLSKIDLTKIDIAKLLDNPLAAAFAQNFKGPEISFPPSMRPPTTTQPNTSSSSSSNPNSQQLPNISTTSAPPIDPALSLRSSMLAHQINVKNTLDRNTLSLNLNDMTDNPTISPQPSISPDTHGSPLSANHRITGGNTHHRSEQQDDFSSTGDYNHHTNNHNNTSNNNSSSNNAPSAFGSNSLNLTDLKLMYHYTTVVAPTITTAGISEAKIWSEDIPQLAFNHPFLMHSILGFSATHLSRTQNTLEQSVTYHRGEALRLLREAVLEISSDNTDALVASALILIMDSLANASLPSSLSPTSLPASAWIFHVKGAATILTAVWPLPLSSRFYKFISVDLSDLGDIINEKNGSISELSCFDESIADLYPVEYDSPYLITLAYLDKLHHEKYKSDFILRIFAFPALLDKTFLALLMSGDLTAMRIMRSYYSLLRGFTTEMKDKVWFLEGVSKVLPADVDDYSGGGGMHMMLDFLGGGLPSMTTTNLALGLNIDINDHFMNP